MENFNLDAAKAELKKVSIAELFAAGFLAKARDGYVCPFCGNGSGRDGTGATVKLAEHGEHLMCGKCSDGYDVIDILGAVWHLNPNDKNEFVEIVQRGCNRFGIRINGDNVYSDRDALPKPNSADDKKKLARIKQDIIDAQKNLPVLLEKHGGHQWRALNKITLQDFRCGYIPDWFARKGAPTTPRVIIPTSFNHYLARLDGNIEDFNVPDGVHLDAKEHRGKKEIFNFNRALLESDNPICFVVEGEIDCMSVAQITRERKDGKSVYPVNVIATGGTKPSPVAWEQLKNLPPKKFIIMFDNDNAGREAAPILAAKLQSFGHQTFIATLSDKYNDPNDFLQHDPEYFQERLREIREEEAHFDDAAQIDSNITNGDIQDSHDATAENSALPNVDMEQFLDDETEDLGNARRLEKFCGERVKWLTDSERWLIWQPKGFWQRGSDKHSCVSPFAAQFADLIKPYAEKLNADFKNFCEQHGVTLKFEGKKPMWAGGDEKTIKQAQIAKARASKAWHIFYDFLKNSRVNSAVNMMKSCSSILITAEDLDRHKNLLNCTNGVVDLETGKLYPADPKLFITQQTAAAYLPDCHDPTIDKFLRDIVPDDKTLAALIRWFGYCLTGEVNEEKSLMICGGGGNGKGTLTLLLMYLCNNYACALPVNAVCEAGRMGEANAHTAELNVLEKKRLAIVEELPQGRRLDVAKFKLLTGGDKIPVRRLHEEFTAIDATHKIVISGNHRPELTDAHDDGLLRRIKSVDFLQKFTEQTRDPHLKEKLLAPNAQNAMLAILVRAAQDWYRDGLIFSDAMERTTRGYFAQYDFISDFISEFCEYGNGKFIELNAFIERIKAEYPGETKIISDRHLKDMIKKLSGSNGVEYRRNTDSKSRRFGLAGIGFKDSHDDFRGTSPDPAYIPD